METCTIKDFSAFTPVPLMPEDIMSKKELYDDTRPSSRSSVCTEERLGVDYLIFFDENRNGVEGDLHELQLERLSLEENGSSEIDMGPNPFEKLLADNFFQGKEDTSVSSKNSLFNFNQFEIPRKKFLSKPDLNSPEEIKTIEENVRVNSILANIRYTWSDDSFLSDDFDHHPLPYDDSDDDYCYRRITSEYPLMVNPIHTPSDGSLIALIDFDMSEGAPDRSDDFRG